MSIRSNTKAAKAAIRKHAEECLRDRMDGYDLGDVSTMPLDELCKAYARQVNYELASRFHPTSTMDKMREDMNSGGPWEVSTYERGMLVGGWLQQTSAEIDRYLDLGMCDDKYTYLLAREICQLAGC